MRTLLILLVLPTIAFGLAETPGADDWKYEEIQRKAGKPFVGLIVKDGGSTVTIRCVTRKRGRPTIVYTEIIPRAEISRIKRLSEEDRKTLEKRLDALKRERQVLADHLRSLDPKIKGKSRDDDGPDLEQVPWPPDEKRKALSYKSAHFHLIADTRPELAQLAAIHLEQIYTAYARSLPPRTKGAPTTILLTRSLAEYQALAKARGLNLFNPAFYDPGRNQVVCGSDLERLCDELQKVRDDHARLRASIKDRRAELNKVYKGKIPPQLSDPLADAEKRMALAEKNNDQSFAQVRERLFRRLYHEAFHAYLVSFVYPVKEGTLPHWFNEGLAQIFETAIVELGELRVGHADEPRLKAVRGALAGRNLLPLTDLLKAEPRQFIVAHANDRQVSDRYYLASWALAFHLTFRRKLLGTKVLDDYVKALKTGRDPLLAFRDLVGMPLDEYEKLYRQDLGKLKLDGTIGQPK